MIPQLTPDPPCLWNEVTGIDHLEIFLIGALL